MGYKTLIPISCISLLAISFVAAGDENQSNSGTKSHAVRALRAHAVIEGAAGSGIHGDVYFTELATERNFPEPGVFIEARIDGLKAGAHGMHLHAVGKCEPDLPKPFSSAGGHFDPGPNGNPDPDANHPFHLGDIPNLIANKRGTAWYRQATSRVTLSKGPLSLLDEDGSAVIVHLNADQGITGETGSGVSGGPRIACGSIELIPSDERRY